MRHLSKFKIYNLVIVLALLLASSCVQLSKVRLLQGTKVGTDNSFDNSKKTTYHLEVGDHLYIKVYSLDPKTSRFFQSDLPSLMNPTYLYLNSYVIDEQGYISFSFIDKMFVKGLTIEEARTQIQKSINEYFKEATVLLRLVNFQVAILGEVNSPGSFTIDKDQITIFQALGLAGGVKDFANVKKVKLVRQTLKGSDVYYLDLTQANILSSDYYYLMPNDILYFEPRAAKNFAFTQFPYGTIFGILSLGISMYVLLK
jgi:polysaccharide export outer membrane protein